MPFNGKAIWICGDRPSYLMQTKLPSALICQALSVLLDQSNPDELVKIEEKSMGQS